jgi:hypothetical protein
MCAAVSGGGLATAAQASIGSPGSRHPEGEPLFGLMSVLRIVYEQVTRSSRRPGNDGDHRASVDPDTNAPPEWIAAVDQHKAEVTARVIETIRSGGSIFMGENSAVAKLVARGGVDGR